MPAPGGFKTPPPFSYRLSPPPGLAEAHPTRTLPSSTRGCAGSNPNPSPSPNPNPNPRPTQLNERVRGLQLSETLHANKLAVCLGDGSRYDTHYDNMGGDDLRKVTALLYLQVGVRVKVRVGVGGQGWGWGWG